MRKLAIQILVLASAFTSIYALANWNTKGLTWTKKGVDKITGVVHVGCGYSNQANECNPYQGDTMCTKELPILCKKEMDLQKPASVSVGRYSKWAKEVVATTRPISPAVAGLTTLKEANQVCEKEFGTGWKVAEFHDGWAWYFKAFGNIGTQVENERFWVNIIDQRNGNCWSQ